MLLDTRPVRFSHQVHWVAGYAHIVALGRGDRAISTLHVLAGVAQHPKGDSLLAGHAKAIARELCIERKTPGFAGVKDLPTQPDFKQLIQTLTECASAAPERSRSRSIRLSDVVRALGAMPESAAFPVLKKYGLTTDKPPTT
jgi:hypothetical protein